MCKTYSYFLKKKKGQLTVIHAFLRDLDEEAVKIALSALVLASINLRL